MPQRLDIWLVQQQHFPSREKARLAIEQGLVLVNDKVIKKGAFKISESHQVVVKGSALAYVSRGGLKLEKAIQQFSIDLNNKRVLDIGASTGGFTDCALQHGASKVYAIDVGTNQLDASLKVHPQVNWYEGLHIRDVVLDHLENQPVDIIVIDVSFISLTQVLPMLPPFLMPDGSVIALVKPQFELGGKVSVKGGIVKDQALRQQALKNVLDCATQAGFMLQGQTETDVEDKRKKNVEFLVHLGFGFLNHIRDIRTHK